MILTLDDVKTQLRLELDFTEHDAMLTQMVNAAQRSIERDYYCKLVTSDEELQALPETVRGFIADEDIRLAIQFLVSDAYRTVAGNRCGEASSFPPAGAYAMSLKPGDMNCRIAISYVQSGRGPLGEPLPEKQVESGKAWAKRELVSGRKVRTLDQQQVVETCLFTVYPGVLVDIDWKITTKNLVYTVRNIDRKTDRIIITGEADGRHDRAGD